MDLDGLRVDYDQFLKKKMAINQVFIKIDHIDSQGQAGTYCNVNIVFI